MFYPHSETMLKGWMVFKPFPKQALVFTCLQYRSFENTVGKGEIARNKQFLLFQQYLFYLLGELCSIFIKYKTCLQTLSVWKSLKFVVSKKVNIISVIAR